MLAYLQAGVLGNPKAAAAYAGVHPRHEQSGQRDRSRLSKQGCPALRRYLYLAALAAIRWDPEIAAWPTRVGHVVHVRPRVGRVVHVRL